MRDLCKVVLITYIYCIRQDVEIPSVTKVKILINT